MTSSDQNADQNNKDLTDQSLSSETIANEIQSPSLIDNNGNNNNSGSRSNNSNQLLTPNNAEEQQIQLQSDQNQLQEQLIEEPQPQNSFVRCAKSVGSAIYNAMYNAGGFLADLFGITTPRYAYALHEYEKHQERLRQRQIELENEANEGELNDIENPTNSLEPEHAE